MRFLLFTAKNIPDLQGVCWALQLSLIFNMWWFPWWLSGKESACKRGRHGFGPWSGKIPHATDNQACGPCIELVLQSEEPQILEPVHSKSHAPQQEKPVHCHLETSPCSWQLERSLHSNEDPAQPKIYKIF